MNKYQIEVIGSAKPYKEIIADYVDSNRDGFYVFRIKNDSDILEPVAYFPIHKTCITAIIENYE